jgi:two-component system NtrC family sensor kinase
MRCACAGALASMRYFLLLLASWLLAAPARTATLPLDTAVLQVKRLPAAGLLLRHGWRYHTGDNPAWARPDFDASAWDTLNPAQRRAKLPPVLGKGISWLRLRLRTGDSLRQHPLLLWGSSRVGAYEIYLNGRLVHKQGLFQADPRRVRPSGSTFRAHFELPPSASPNAVLAIRFAPWEPPLAQNVNIDNFFNLTLIGPEQFRHWEAGLTNITLIYFGAACLAGLLALLHLAFFFFNPAQRANFYFALYAGAMALAALGTFYLTRLPFATTGDTLIYDFVTGYVLLCLSGLWGVRALYSLFGFRPGWVYAGLWGSCAVLLAVFGWYLYESIGWLAYNGAVALLTLEQLRLVGRALRQRQRGAWIIGVGFAVALLALAGFTTLLLGWVRASPIVFELFTFFLTSVPPALAISLFLAREFALDSQLLQVKLSEIERLSAQTITQEQEKQALLAQQNETLEHQVAERTGELQRSLTDLRATQTQLIQKEKMASLGELTAGIAHEIQNPLNFVNNFSEVSTELVAELREERAKGAAADTGLEEDLLTDLDQNLVKITEHGRRAAGIVRGMLEHSRTSSGERALTNMNQLADEYLRLAYHGLRAKDKTFNAELQTDFASNLPLVEGVGADLGRVLLNLFNNAFYAVQQRQLAGEAGYVPTVRVHTTQVGQQVVVHVQDNGTGMSPEVQAKIFQPFFTTKPTGEGSGLGLSLSHDIISQGHGGTLSVDSRVGQGSTFHVRLPARQ